MNYLSQLAWRRSTVILLFFAISGCGQVEQTNQHLGSMDLTTQKMAEEIKRDGEYLAAFTQELKSIAESLKSFELLGNELQSLLKNTFKPKPPSKTDDIEDVLKGTQGVKK
jgi:hypothetical protein